MSINPTKLDLEKNAIFYKIINSRLNSYYKICLYLMLIVSKEILSQIKNIYK